jgi:hypothetical protein
LKDAPLEGYKLKFQKLSLVREEFSPLQMDPVLIPLPSDFVGLPDSIRIFLLSEAQNP